MTVMNDMVKPRNALYYSVGFRQIIEDHLEYLRNNGAIQQLPVNVQDGNMWSGDYYGLLTYLNIPLEMHYITLRVNGMTSPTDYDGSVLQILLPDSDVTDALLQQYRSISTII